MSGWLLLVVQHVVSGTFQSAAFAIDGVYTILEAIAGRKVGEYVLPVATINELSKFGGQRARNKILEMREPTLDELQVGYPGKEDIGNYRVVSFNPRNYQG